MGAEEPTPFLSLTEVWAAFGTSDPAVGMSRLEVFVRARLEEEFANPLLHGSEHLARCVAPLVEPHRDILDHQSAERHCCRPSIGTLFDGRVHQAELDEAARASPLAHRAEEGGPAVLHDAPDRAAAAASHTATSLAVVDAEAIAGVGSFLRECIGQHRADRLDQGAQRGRGAPVRVTRVDARRRGDRRARCRASHT